MLGSSAQRKGVASVEERVHPFVSEGIENMGTDVTGLVDVVMGGKDGSLIIFKILSVKYKAML